MSLLGFYVSKRVFPLNKKLVGKNNSATEFLSSYKNETEYPIAPHPGSFAFVRKNHIHEGVDLYAEQGDEVLAMEEGVVVNVLPFTGNITNPKTSWWNDTGCVLIKSRSGVICYGELKAKDGLKKGDFVQTGEVLGYIETVLKKDKGRPMAMLHLEFYSHDVTEPTETWSPDMATPYGLQNPIILFEDFFKS
jgi:murein DD-endopeptidase MepM/ murein hydrolase activator NlpD